MGIDTHGFNFVRYALKRQQLGFVATIGRQSLALPPARVSKLLGRGTPSSLGPYCEELLIQYMGAQLVESYDYSDYEGATHVVDMNKPIEPQREYDTVIDCGSLEHIYNMPQAFTNVSTLCRDNGQIIHVLPANNFCGHGFWQFSPELFFSLYSEKNGYRETEVFIANLKDNRHWFEVKEPSNGKRAEVISKSPLYVMCRTIRCSPVRPADVQQSDYIDRWTRGSAPLPERGRIFVAAKKFIKKSAFLHGFALSLYKTAGTLRNPTVLSNRNPFLKRHNVGDLLAKRQAA